MEMSKLSRDTERLIDEIEKLMSFIHMFARSYGLETQIPRWTKQDRASFAVNLIELETMAISLYEKGDALLSEMIHSDIQNQH